MISLDILIVVDSSVGASVLYTSQKADNDVTVSSRIGRQANRTQKQLK